MTADLQVFNDDGVFTLSSEVTPITYIHKQSVYVSGANPVLVTLPFNLNGRMVGMNSNSIGATLLYHSHSDNSITVEVLLPPLSGTHVVTLYVLSTIEQVVSRENYGLELYNADGSLKYSSSFQNTTGILSGTVNIDNSNREHYFNDVRGTTVVVPTMNPIRILKIASPQGELIWTLASYRTEGHKMTIGNFNIQRAFIGAPGQFVVHRQQATYLICKVFD